MKTIAQLTYLPLSTEKPKELVQDLLEFVAQYDLEVDVNHLSTTVEGDTEVIFKLIRDMYEEMMTYGDHFRFHVELLSPIRE